MGPSMSVCRIFFSNLTTLITLGHCVNTSLQQWETGSVMEHLRQLEPKPLLEHDVETRPPLEHNTATKEIKGIYCWLQ
jgi:hypothetical protein